MKIVYGGGRVLIAKYGTSLEEGRVQELVNVKMMERHWECLWALGPRGLV